jgi:hypothetical protein
MQMLELELFRFALKTDEAVYGVVELLGRHLDPASVATVSWTSGYDATLAAK